MKSSFSIIAYTEKISNHNHKTIFWGFVLDPFSIFCLYLYAFNLILVQYGHYVFVCVCTRA